MESNFLYGLYENYPMIGFSILLGALLGFFYSISNKPSNYSNQLSFTIFSTTLIMTFVALIINVSIATSIGLFGVLSILRFRSNIENILDMSYMLLSVTTGLLIGFNHLILAATLVTIFGVALFIFTKSSKKDLYQNTLILDGSILLDIDKIISILHANNLAFKVENNNSNIPNSTRELIISINGSDREIAKTISEIENIKDINTISTLSHFQKYI